MLKWTHVFFRLLTTLPSHVQKAWSRGETKVVDWSASALHCLQLRGKRSYGAACTNEKPRERSAQQLSSSTLDITNPVSYTRTFVNLVDRILELLKEAALLRSISRYDGSQRVLRTTSTNPALGACHGTARRSTRPGGHMTVPGLWTGSGGFVCRPLRSIARGNGVQQHAAVWAVPPVTDCGRSNKFPAARSDGETRFADCVHSFCDEPKTCTGDRLLLLLSVVATPPACHALAAIVATGEST